MGGGTPHSSQEPTRFNLCPFRVRWKLFSNPQTSTPVLFGLLAPFLHLPRVPSTAEKLSVLCLSSELTPQMGRCVEGVLTALFTPGVHRQPQRLGNE